MRCEAQPHSVENVNSIERARARARRFCRTQKRLSLDRKCSNCVNKSIRINCARYILWWSSAVYSLASAQMVGEWLILTDLCVYCKPQQYNFERILKLYSFEFISFGVCAFAHIIIRLSFATIEMWMLHAFMLVSVTSVRLISFFSFLNSIHLMTRSQWWWRWTLAPRCWMHHSAWFLAITHLSVYLLRACDRL